MIQLECSNCRADLSIDDAFAGGVCRCQHCGTIQTVPKRGAAASAAAASPQALFKRKARIESALNPYSDNLDRVADEIESGVTLTPSAISNLSPGRQSGPTPMDPSAVTATKSAPATGKPYFVPRPSSSSKPTADDNAPAKKKPGGRSRKTDLIAAIVGIIIGACIWIAVSNHGSSKKTPTPPPVDVNSGRLFR